MGSATWPQDKDTTMPELLIDFITSLDGYAAAEGWPGWWGLEGPEHLAWLGEAPEADYTLLMGATTYRVMSGLAAAGEPGTEPLARMSKVVFSKTLREPLAWANTQLDLVGHLVVTVGMVRVVHGHSEDLAGSGQRLAVEGVAYPASAIDGVVTCWISKDAEDCLR